MTDARPQASPRPQGFRTARRRLPISLTPLIDLVFILLVFFMLASSFLDWRAIPLDVRRDAQGSAASGGGDRALVVDLRADGPAIAGQTVSDVELAARVAAHLVEGAGEGARPVIVRPAPNVPLQTAIDLLDTLSAQGVAALSLARTQ